MSNPANDKNRLLFWLSRKINYPLVSPEVIQFSLTYRCNLNCKMCKIVNLAPVQEELTTSQILFIIDQAAAYGIKEALFSGGEPFLREDIFEICRYCHDKGISSVITTNGVLIDKALAREITGSKVNHIHFSLDGLEQNNDFFRGIGTFKKIIRAIEIVNRAKRGGGRLTTGIAYTVMNENVKDLYAVLKLADDLDVDVINFQPLVKDNTNFLDRSRPQFWVKAENIYILTQEIKKIRNYKARHITVDEEPSLELLPKYYQDNLGRKDWVCFGGFKTAFVCFSKKQPFLYSCHGTCGNLNEVSLRKAWTSKEAYRLRLHSGRCQDLCLQSCYSKQSSQSWKNLYKTYER